MRHTLRKAERLHSKKLIEGLFGGVGERHSMSAFPLRVVYQPIAAPPSQMLISVPKRCFKRAVKRNRVKRQVREAYRLNKQLLGDRTVIMAFIWLDCKLHPSRLVHERVVSLLQRIREREDKRAEP